MHGVGSRNKLRASHARLYPGSGMLDRLGRAICTAECLPRKELHEAWEMATRVRQCFTGGRVVDLCCGYGLLGQVMLLLDDSLTAAIAVDVKVPPNHGRIHRAIAGEFPHLRGRVRFVNAPLQGIDIDVDDIVVSAHACGPLSDDVISTGADRHARLAVLPCCHQYRRRADLAGLPDPALAMDIERAVLLRARGYRVWTPSIPVEVSPKNRLLLGAPASRVVVDHDDAAASQVSPSPAWWSQMA